MIQSTSKVLQLSINTLQGALHSLLISISVLRFWSLIKSSHCVPLLFYFSAFDANIDSLVYMTWHIPSMFSLHSG